MRDIPNRTVGSDRPHSIENTVTQGSEPLQQEGRTTHACATSDARRAMRERLRLKTHRWMAPTAREILTYLSDQSDYQGVSQVTIEEIAQAVECCERTVQRYIGMLRIKHWLWVSYIKIGPKRNEPNVYRLLLNGDPWQRGETLTQSTRPPSRPSAEQRTRDPKEKRARRRNSADRDAVEEGTQAAGDGGGAPEENGNTVQRRSPQDAFDSGGSAPPTEGDRRDTADTDSDLDAIGPRVPYRPPTRPHVRPARLTFAERIRSLLILCGFESLAGDGLEIRLSRMFMARSIHADAPVEHLLSVLATKRQESLLAAGEGPSPWKGTVDAQRAYLFAALRKMQLPELDLTKKPKPARLSPRHELENLRRAERVDAPPVREHENTMAFIPSKTIGGEVAQKIHDAIVASYHGVQPLKDLDAVVIANRLQHRCIETGSGTLHVDDIVGTIKLFATYQAFRLKRNEITPPAALESFFFAEMKKIVRGCGAEKAAQAAKAKPFGSSSAPIRQPGTDLNHLKKKPNEITPDQMFAILGRDKEKKP